MRTYTGKAVRMGRRAKFAGSGPVLFSLECIQTHPANPHMTHQIDPELLNNALQLLTDEGSPGFSEGLRLLVKKAMV